MHVTGNMPATPGPGPRILPNPVGGPFPLTAPGFEKYARQQERNQQLYTCCRNPANLTARRYKSDPALAAPDILVATCVCGRNHHTLKVGEGEKPDPAWAR